MFKTCEQGREEAMGLATTLAVFETEVLRSSNKVVSLFTVISYLIYPKKRNNSKIK